MSIGPFKQRSSLPSSFITGLIGWNGFFIIVGAVLGMADRAGQLFLLGTAAAICQIVFLRIDYGRDAHWLEPFFFGVVAYLIAFWSALNIICGLTILLGAASMRTVPRI